MKKPVDLHHDHLRWESELNQWLQELEQWQDQLGKLREALRTLDKSITDMEHQYQQHQNGIGEHQLAIDKHEAELSTSAQDISHLTLEVNQGHQIQLQKHLALKEQQKRLWAYHDLFRRQLEALRSY